MIYGNNSNWWVGKVDPQVYTYNTASSGTFSYTVQTPTDAVLREIRDERAAQDEKWAEQNHPDGTGAFYLEQWAREYRIQCNEAFEDGRGTWRHIALEEVYEALAERDPNKLRAELVQAAAVLAAWIEAIDRRSNATAQEEGEA